MEEVTLADVGNRALADPDFWRQLRVEPDRTLDAYGMPLSRPDRERLTGALTGAGLEEMDNLFRAVQTSIEFRPPRRGGWNGLWRWGLPYVPGQERS